MCAFIIYLSYYCIVHYICVYMCNNNIYIKRIIFMIK